MSNAQSDSGKDKFDIARPHDLLPRSAWLREYYFKGAEREWNNEYMAFTTGVEWDIVWEEMNYYVAPEVIMYIGVDGKGVFETSLRSIAERVELPENFWDLSLPERKIEFFERVMLDYIPQEIISDNDLIAGGRFNTQLSNCLNEKETKKY
jgi:hypothetical protein